MKYLLTILCAIALTGCAGSAPTQVKCPVAPPDAPQLTWSGNLPQTEIELQQEFLRLKAAYEESVEAEQAWRSLWNDC